MRDLTNGEMIIFAEREKDNIKREYDFCLDIMACKINVKKHFSYMLVESVYPRYAFDEDEQYYFEIAHEETGISKKAYIKKRKEEIRNEAKKAYISKVNEYANIREKVNDLEKALQRAEKVINEAKRKYGSSYYFAKYVTQRAYSPSFVFAHSIGGAILAGMTAALEGKKVICSDIDKLEIKLKKGD